MQISNRASLSFSYNLIYLLLIDIILLSHTPCFIPRKGILLLQHLVSKFILKETKPNEFQLMETEHPEMHLRAILWLLLLWLYLCWLWFDSLIPHFPSLWFLSPSYNAYSLVTLCPIFQLIIVTNILTEFLWISLHAQFFMKPCSHSPVILQFQAEFSRN